MDKVAEFKELIYKQANILDKKDLYYKYDDFKNGKKNVLLISGYSGSGKTTLGKDIANRHGAHFVEMDDFVKKKDSNPNIPIVKEYFEKNPHMKPKVNEATQYHLFHDYYNHAMDYARKHPDKKFVFEGVQLLGKVDDNDLPRVVKGTGMVHSNMRAHKRMFQSKFKRLGFSEGLNGALHPKVNTERFMVNKLINGYTPKQVEELAQMRSNGKLGTIAAGAAGVATGALLHHQISKGVHNIQGKIKDKKDRKQQEQQKVAMYKNHIYNMAK